jgi:hypothetical protein
MRQLVHWECVSKITHYVKLTLFTMSTVSHPSTRIPIKIGGISRSSTLPYLSLQLDMLLIDSKIEVYFADKTRM